MSLRGGPYRNVEVGHEVEVRVFTDEQEGQPVLIAEVEFRGDKYGGALPLAGLEGPGLATEVDKLVGGTAEFVYDELLGTPIFRDDDEAWVGRVDARRDWEGRGRRPSAGLIAGGVAEVPGRGPVAAPGPVTDLAAAAAAEGRFGSALEDGGEGDSVAVALGDANVLDVKLTEDEALALSRGDVPDMLVERLLRARSTGNLLDSVARVIDEVVENAGQEGFGRSVVRAQQELAEVLRRFRDG